MSDNEAGFSGEIALVTGASRGIGEAIAVELGHLGALVIGTATSSEGVATIEETFAREDIEGFGLELDLKQPDTFKDRVSGIVGRAGGPISILINNAGITRDVLTASMQEEDWDEVIDTDLKGPVFLTKAVLAGGMQRAKRGNVVSIGSVIGTLGGPGQANYAAAKAGLVAATKSLAQEYAKRPLMRFNVVAPGFVDTDMTDALSAEQRAAILDMVPSHKMLTPKDIADGVIDTLRSDKNGEVVAIDGGLTN